MLKDEPLSRKAKLFYGTGDFGFALTDTVIGVLFATFVYMPYYALTPELSQDYDERTNLTSYRMFFSLIGQLIAFTVPFSSPLACSCLRIRLFRSSNRSCFTSSSIA